MTCNKCKRIEQVLDDLESGKIKPKGRKPESYIVLEKIKDIIWS